MGLAKTVKRLYEKFTGIESQKRFRLNMDFISLSMKLNIYYRVGLISKADSVEYVELLKGFKQGLDELTEIYNNPLFERAYNERCIYQYHQQAYNTLLSFRTHEANNPYNLLGLQEKASDGELKSAFRRLAKKYHPDHNPGNKEADEKFRQIKDAYKTLQKIRGFK